MEDLDYKSLHERLTSNNNGTTAFESTIVVVPSIISLYIVAGVRALQHCSPEEENFISSFFIEFLCVIMPCILCFTVMADYLSLVFVVLFLTCFVLFVMNHVDGKGVKHFYSRSHDKKTQKAIMSYRFNPSRRSFLTNFRAITNMLTVLSILAVDFHIFPRRFAKTETFGFGVMDLGVGLFVIANALVAPETRSDGALDIPLLKTLVQCIPLIILGAGRVFFTNQVNYQEHVTEYGEHWNFFFTLAVTRVLCTIILKLVKHHTGIYLLLSLMLLSLYEMILYLGVRDWILGNSPRFDFISANREGLASNIGYVALYFGGVTFGRMIREWERLNAVNNWSTIKKLAITTVILWTITIFCHSTIGISRRLANAGYIFWILSFTTTVLTLLLIVECCVLLLQFLSVGSKNHKPNPNVTYVPTILEAINMNGLLFFLLGNVLTGLINLTFKTFQLHAIPSLLIIILYMFINCVTVSFLCHKKIALKF